PQAVNAEMFCRAGAATMALDRDLTVARLHSLLLPLLADDSRRAAMGAAARALGRPNAATDLARAVAELAQGTGSDMRR
ncbi:MAG: undecaprenyldiphospho-muramoylpentapeptide beta-N-acetylglucosaminyltransferase, partial [Ktedonobacterales bacterium]